MDTSVDICGELDAWPSKYQLARILRKAGLTVCVGSYSVRIEDYSHFVFQDYGGDLGSPQIDADADSLDEMLSEAKSVSEALAAAGIRHRFEIYDDSDEMVGYLHHEWER